MLKSIDLSMPPKLPRPNALQNLPFSCTPTKPDTTKGLHPGDNFCRPLTVSHFPQGSLRSRGASSLPHHQSRTPPHKDLPVTIAGHVPTCSRGAGSISHPSSQLGASAPAHVLCRWMRGAGCCGEPRACSLHAPCATNLYVYHSIRPGLLNICSQKHGQVEKMEVKEHPRRHTRGRVHKCCDCHRLLHSCGQEPSLHPLHGQGDKLHQRWLPSMSMLWPNQSLFHF